MRIIGIAIIGSAFMSHLRMTGTALISRPVQAGAVTGRYDKPPSRFTPRFPQGQDSAACRLAGKNLPQIPINAWNFLFSAALLPGSGG